MNYPNDDLFEQMARRFAPTTSAIENPCACVFNWDDKFVEYCADCLVEVERIEAEWHYDI